MVIAPMVRRLLGGAVVVLAMMALGLPWVPCPACVGPGASPPPTILAKVVARIPTFQNVFRPEPPPVEDNGVTFEIRSLRFTPITWVPICTRCRGQGRLPLL